MPPVAVASGRAKILFRAEAAPARTSPYQPVPARTKPDRGQTGFEPRLDPVGGGGMRKIFLFPEPEIA